MSQDVPQKSRLSLVPPVEDAVSAKDTQRTAQDGSVRDDNERDRSGLSDAVLVEAATGGGRWAHEALFRRHVAWVDRLAYRIAPREADADDIVQESFAEALTNLSRLREPAAFRGWLRTIVLHTARHLLRRRRLRRRLGLDSSFEFDPELVISRNAPPDVTAELHRVYSRIEDMPPDVRIVVVLRRVERWTVPEIAKELRVSEGTVKRRVKKGDRFLRRTVKQGRAS